MPGSPRCPHPSALLCRWLLLPEGTDDAVLRIADTIAWCQPVTLLLPNAPHDSAGTL